MAVPKFGSDFLARAVLHLLTIYGEAPHNRAFAVLLFFGTVDIKECLECASCHDFKVLR